MTCNVFDRTLNLTQSIYASFVYVHASLKIDVNIVCYKM